MPCTAVSLAALFGWQLSVSCRVSGEVSIPVAAFEQAGRLGVMRSAPLPAPPPHFCSSREPCAGRVPLSSSLHASGLPERTEQPVLALKGRAVSLQVPDRSSF